MTTEIIQLIDAGERCCFPNGAFGAFAVAEEDVGAIIQLVEPRAQGHAHTDAKALAKRTGRNIHERKPRRGMTFEVAGQLAKREQMFAREKPEFSPGRIKQRARPWPFDKMKRSLFAYLGSLGSNRMWPKKRAATTSAAEQHELG